LGISAIIKPLPFQMKNNLDIGVVVLASLLLFLFMFTGKKRSLDRWEGFIFLICYGVFVAYLVFTD
jgi:cation:H+ antiporter